VGIGDVVSAVIPEKPEGNPDEIDDAANQWAYYAQHLSGIMSQARHNVAGQVGSWHGPARLAFDEQWNAFADGVEAGCREMESAAKELRHAADMLRLALVAHDVALASLAVGTVVTIATLGSGLLATGTAMSVEVAAAVTAAAAARAAAAAAARALANLAVLLATRFVVNFGENIAFEASMNAITRADHNPIADLHYRDGAEDAVASLFTGGAIKNKKPSAPNNTKSNIAGKGDTAKKAGSSPALRGAKNEPIDLEDDRIRALGMDPKNGGTPEWKDHEAKAAVRAERHDGVTLHRFKNGDLDWYDDQGRKYDALGTGMEAKFFDKQWNSGRFKEQIFIHVDKADRVPIDIELLEPDQVAKISKFLEENKDRVAGKVFFVGD
jgi:WXG100 family type VII secretion target